MHDDVPAPGANLIELHAARRARRPSRPSGVTGLQPGLLYTVAALVVALGAVAGLVVAALDVVQTRGASPYALRVLARSLPLAVAALVHLRRFAPGTLLLLTLVLGFAHLGDFAVAIVGRDAWRLGVPLVCALSTLACAIPQIAELAGKSRKP